jgi:kumamolisin
LAKDRTVPLRGSEKKAVAGATEIGSVDPKERIEITIIARPDESSKTTSAEVLGRLPVSKRVHVSREEFAALCSSNQDNVAKIVKFAKDNSLQIVEVNSARRSVVLSGLAPQFSGIFQVELKRFKHPSNNGTFRGRSGPLFIPEGLSSAVLAILGLDDRSQAGTHFRLLRPSLKVISSYTPPQLARIYDFPSGLDGSNECIGIIELGGGETPADLSAYFRKLGLTTPKVVTVSVDHGSNNSYRRSQWTRR